MERRTLAAIVSAVMILLLPAIFAGLSSGEGRATMSMSEVLWARNASPVPGGESMLVRTDGGIAMALHTSGLVDGNAYTVWWVVFNHPESCAGVLAGHPFRCGASDLGVGAVGASVLYAAGHVVGGGGIANFGGYLTIYDTSGALFGPGLTNPRGADIHLIVRDHGPVIPELVTEQISSFGGACSVNACANVQMSIQEAA